MGMSYYVSDYLKAVGFSLIAYLCVFWTSDTTPLNAVWCYSLMFFLMTYLLCNKYVVPGGLSETMVILAILLGRFLIDVPVRLANWGTSYGFILLLIESVMGIILGYLCWKEKSPVVFLLSLVIMILVNSFVPHVWIDFIMSRVPVPYYVKF